MNAALRELGRSLNEAWGSVAEGWRELLRRSGNALTRFTPRKRESSQHDTGERAFPVWGMLAGEVIESGNKVRVNVELPGLAREDCEITVGDGTLRIRGEKRMEREHAGDSYYVMERAYGRFERVIPLPAGVDPDSAKATFRDGILRVEFARAAPRRRITVK